MLQGPECEYTIVNVDTGLLFARRDQIFRIALEQRQIHYLLEYISHCIKLLQQHYATITGLNKQAIERISEALLNDNGKGQLQNENELYH